MSLTRNAGHENTKTRKAALVSSFRAFVACAPVAVVLLWSAGADAQRGAGQAPAPPTPQAAAPIDLTGYWVSIIVDEWRFRVTPQKGDILYLPLTAEARQSANAWDPAKDEAEGSNARPTAPSA